MNKPFNHDSGRQGTYSWTKATRARQLPTHFLLMILLLASPVMVIAEINAKPGNESQKAILVTGASTGSGRMIAETLAAGGHLVFAGARKQQDLEELDAIENIQSLRLDVTIQSEIEQSANRGTACTPS